MNLPIKINYLDITLKTDEKFFSLGIPAPEKR